jgi:hypothetical protein
MKTRSTNSQHPAYELGVAAPKRKKRTPAEISAEKEADNTKKAEANAAKKANIRRVADLEEQIAEEDSVDVTPRPLRPRPHLPRRLQRTETRIDVLSSDEGMEVGNDCASSMDFHVEVEATGEDGDTEIEEDTRATKKAKVQKPRTRDEIDEARKEVVSEKSKEKAGEKEYHDNKEC